MQKIAFSELPSFVGQELGVSDWFLMDQETVDGFAKATRDFEWIHVDVERSNREYGGTIAHGYLTLSMIPYLMESLMELTGLGDGQSLNYGLNKVRFINRVRVGKRVRMRQTLLGIEPKGEGQVVRYEFVIDIEGETKPALIAEGLFLLHAATPVT